jgi:hypothetical protein
MYYRMFHRPWFLTPYVGAQMSGTWSPRYLNFAQSHLIFSASLWPFLPVHENVYHVTHTKLNALDESEIHRLLQSCRASASNLCHVTFLVPIIWRLLLDF